jgi:hypothetical protein
VSRATLGYSRLISTLEMIDGETVVVRLFPLEAGPDSPSGGSESRR